MRAVRPSVPFAWGRTHTRHMRGDAYRWFVRGAAVTFGVALAFVVIATLALSTRVIVLVLMAVLLASALEPVVGLIRARFNAPRAASIVLVYLAFLLVVLFLGLLIVPSAIGQVGSLSDGIPSFLDHARAWASGLRPQALSTSALAMIDAAGSFLQSGPKPEPSQIVNLGLTVADGFISVATVLTIVFFWLTERARLQRYALSFLPPERRSGVREAWNEVELRLGLWVRGQLTLMAIVAAATAVAYTLLGLPSSLLLALIAGLAEAIPIVGPTLGAVPALLVAIAARPDVVIPVAIVYVVIQFVEGNVLVPYIMKNAIGISPFMVLVSLLIGSQVAGVIGALLAVPLAAAIEAVLERLQAREVPVAQEPSHLDESALPETMPGPDAATVADPPKRSRRQRQIGVRAEARQGTDSP